MPMSLPLARTVIWAIVALSTVPSNLGGCGPLCGLTVLMMIGIASSAIGTAIGAGTWALAAAAAKAAKPAASAQRSRGDCETGFIRVRRYRCPAISINERLGA